MKVLIETLLKRPFLFLITPYIVGILGGKYIGIGIPSYIVPFLFSFSILLYLLKRPFIALSLLSISISILSMERVEMALNPTFPPDHVARMANGGYVILEGVIYRVEESIGRERLYIEVDRAFSGKVTSVRGRVLLTIGDREGSYSPGQRVRFKARLRRPRNLGNPGGFDYKGYLASRGIYVTGYVKESGWVVPVGEGGSLVGRLRGRIGAFLERIDPPLRGLTKALILGERGEVDRGTRDLFVKTGTAHLLAISGLHIGIIAFIFYTITLGLLRSSEYLLLLLDVRRLAAILTILPVVLYSMIGGFSIPTQRALLFSLAFLFSLFIGRERDYYNLLALAAFLILLFSPLSMFQISFQLSFVAVLSILLFSPVMGRGRWRWMRDLLIVSMVTFVGTLPILLHHFYRISTVGVVANIVAVPLIGFVSLPFLLVSSLLSLLSETIASYLLIPGLYALEWGLRWLAFLSDLPWAYVHLRPLPFMGLALYYLSFGGLALFFNKGRREALLLFLPFLLWLITWSFWKGESKELVVTFIDVGHGDSVLVEFPEGRKMLIDGGGGYGGFDAGERVVAPLLWRKGIRRIDYVVLTSQKREHTKGLISIVRNFGVGEFLWNGEEPNRRDSKELLSLLREKGVRLRVVDSTTPSFKVDGVRVDILYPLPPSYTKISKDRPLVVKLTFGRMSFLFPGDIGMEDERTLLQKGPHLKSTFLKVPNHGSRASSSIEFLKALSPQVAILSVGSRNPFNLPHPEVLRRYSDLDIRLLRTDEAGAITITTDGIDYRLETFR